jgi:hypothetical protein
MDTGKKRTAMLNTFERDLIANERHLDLLRSFAERQRNEQATRSEWTTGFLAIFTGRRRAADNARLNATATAVRAA